MGSDADKKNGTVPALQILGTRKDTPKLPFYTTNHTGYGDIKQLCRTPVLYNSKFIQRDKVSRRDDNLLHFIGERDIGGKLWSAL